MYGIFFTKKAVQDIELLKVAKLNDKAKYLIEILKENPYQAPPNYEKLRGDLQGAYSRRINIKHRIVYEIINEDKTVKIISMWTHYEF
ncbi:MAG: Txe/YoeB family addiction module toxin [Eubacteriales bacterium]|nr:Txe/YoeB family addiction module toxin [Eubacteriales bacterium]